MITFTDKKLYLKGTAEAVLIDKQSGDIVYYSDKFQTANYATSVTMGEIRAGIGNGIAAILPSDAAVNVNFTAADFSLAAKAMQVGAARTYGAPVMTCQTVTASGTSLTISVTGGAPVAAPGMASAICWVQEVGAESPIATGGTAYAISAAGAISGFTSTNGKSYKVTYFVNRANAEMATITTAMDPFVGYFMSSMAVYSSAGANPNEGTRVGTLWAIVPSLKLGADGGVTGDQTTADTTSLTGQAIAYDEEIISSGCDDCSGAGDALAYYIYAPCDVVSGVEGVVGVLGGAVSFRKSTTYQLHPYVVVNGKLSRAVPPSNFSYSVASTSSVSVGASTGLLTATSTAGSTTCTITYSPDGGTTTFTDVITVTITN